MENSKNVKHMTENMLSNCLALRGHTSVKDESSGQMLGSDSKQGSQFKNACGARG